MNERRRGKHCNVTFLEVKVILKRLDEIEEISGFMRQSQSSIVPLGAFEGNCGDLGPSNAKLSVDIK